MSILMIAGHFLKEIAMAIFRLIPPSSPLEWLHLVINCITGDLNLEYFQLLELNLAYLELAV